MTNVQLYKELAKGFGLVKYGHTEHRVLSCATDTIRCASCSYSNTRISSCVKPSIWKDFIPKEQLATFKLQYPEFFI